MIVPGCLLFPSASAPIRRHLNKIGLYYYLLPIRQHPVHALPLQILYDFGIPLKSWQ
uniref:Uncharacterized protein n=1 Tax=Yersinia enterocolitica TaxID=630 RepID=B0RKS3_YEREN|nr:hypothetical protein [Yersinia enterocolitica]